MPADAKVAAILSMTRVQMNMPPLDIPDTCILAVSTHSLLVTSYSTAFIIFIIGAANDPSVFTITEKAPTRAFSWLKVPTSAFTFKTLKHYDLFPNFLYTFTVG